MLGITGEERDPMNWLAGSSCYTVGFKNNKLTQ